MKNPLSVFRNIKSGLALGSGGAKGLSHIAVIEYLTGMGIPIDMIAGSSIGAVAGAVYCSGKLEAFRHDMLTFTKKELLSVFDLTVPKSGLLKGNDFTEFMKRYIPADTKIEDFHIPLAIVATDFYTGKGIVFRKGNVLEALRASVSIPGVFVPVAYNDTFLVDGGVANPLPVDVIRRMGAGFTVAVNLHPGIKTSRVKKYVQSGAEKIGITAFSETLPEVDDRKGVTVPVEKKQSGWIKNLEQWISSRNEKIVYPSIFEVLSQSIDIMGYANTVNMLKHYRPTVLIEPDLLATGTLDFTDAYRIITEGFRACADKKSELSRKIKFWL
jgi:NTE family protein